MQTSVSRCCDKKSNSVVLKKWFKLTKCIFILVLFVSDKKDKVRFF